MIIEQSPDGIGEARFSDCRRYRYALRRFITAERKAWRSVVFVMLNPSTADAFKLDPTVRKCLAFARLWGFDAVQVVNLFALRSPHPADLYVADRLASPTNLYPCGDNPVNDQYLLAICAYSDLAIAAWGNHGHDKRLGERGAVVRDMLEGNGVELHHLGLCDGGAPIHPLARGKAHIPMHRQPTRWAA